MKRPMDISMETILREIIITDDQGSGMLRLVEMDNMLYELRETEHGSNEPWCIHGPMNWAQAQCLFDDLVESYEI